MNTKTPQSRIYKVVFNPEISATCKTFILNEISESYNNGDSYFYSMPLVIETLKEEIDQNNGEEIFGIKKEDIKELERLIEMEKITAVELF